MEALIPALVGLLTNPMATFLFVTVAVVALVLIYAQFKRDQFDLRTLIEGEDGKLSIHKIGQLVALWLSSWGFVYLILYKEMTEFYFVGFMSCWASVELLSSWLNKKTGS